MFEGPAVSSELLGLVWLNMLHTTGWKHHNLRDTRINNHRVPYPSKTQKRMFTRQAKNLPAAFLRDLPVQYHFGNCMTMMSRHICRNFRITQQVFKIGRKHFFFVFSMTTRWPRQGSLKTEMKARGDESFTGKCPRTETFPQQYSQCGPFFQETAESSRGAYYHGRSTDKHNGMGLDVESEDDQ